MKKIQARNYLLLFVLFFMTSATPQSLASNNNDPQLSVKTAKRTWIFSRSELLKRNDLTLLKVENDPAFSDREMTYEAVPIYALFSGIEVPTDATIQFQCLDGFSAPISRDLFLNQSSSGSIAFLAIERKNRKWPAIHPPENMQTPGPFYLIWKNPKASGIGREEWPFQLSGFEVQNSLRSTFPAVFPAHDLSESHAVNQGFRLFMKNCFSCHTLNLQGRTQMGPDLNVPMNPVEYLNASALGSLIRNPQALRYWPNSKMKGFSKKELSDTDVGNIIEYLTYMSKRKVKLPTEKEKK